MNSETLIIENKINIYKITDNLSYTFYVPENKSSSLYLYIDGSNELSITLGAYSSLDLIIITKTSKDINYRFDLDKSATLNLYSSDIILSNINTNKEIYLNGTDSSLFSYEFSMVNNYKVNSKVITYHNNLNTKADSTYQLLTKGTSIIDKEVIAVIEKGMTDSASSEIIKGMMLSKKSKINAKPVLVVKHDDVKANHGCAIGTVDQNEIYYLMSRGLTYKDAMFIISRSFIAPILKAIKDEEFKEFITPILEELINE